MQGNQPGLEDQEAPSLAKENGELPKLPGGGGSEAVALESSERKPKSQEGDKGKGPACSRAQEPSEEAADRNG